MSEEQVLVVPRQTLGPFIDFRGFRDLSSPPPHDWLQYAGFKPRPAMETDAAYKQLIPYIILHSKDQVFRYRRTQKGGESRLHDLYSIGVGGHINPEDGMDAAPSSQWLEQAALRELNEEMDLKQNPSLQCIGFLNDDEVTVGVYHLGIVYEAHFPEPDLQLGEDALAAGEWLPVERLNDGAEYETWSQFVIDYYLAQ